MKRKNRRSHGAAAKKLRVGEARDQDLASFLNTAVCASVADGSQLPVSVVPALELSAPEIGCLKDKLSQRGAELEKPHRRQDMSRAWSEQKNSGKTPNVS
jgi:hypothetical protein